MRHVATLCLPVLLLAACASVQTQSDLAAMPGATPGMIAADQANRTVQAQQAQLRDIRNAQARVTLARPRIDLDRTPDEDDARELLSARDALRRARNVYGPTETGFDDRPFAFPIWRRKGPRGTMPLGFNGRSVPQSGWMPRQSSLSGSW